MSYNLFLLLTLILAANCGISILGPDALTAKFQGELSIQFAQSAPLHDFHAHGRIFLETVTESHSGCLALYALNLFANEEDNFRILLVNKGGCPVSTKARKAQEIGANMLLVINDRDNEEFVLEDGVEDIYIKVAFINNSQGKTIEDFIMRNKNERVLVYIDFNEQFGKEVEVKFFFSSSETRAYELIENFSKYQSQFGKQVVFKPVYRSHIHPFYLEHNPSRMDNCVSKGKYCYFPTQSTIVQDGAQIILQSLRQKCFYNLNKDYTAIANYYTYMSQFYRQCIDNGFEVEFNSACDERVLVYLGYGRDYLDKCYAQSFGVSAMRDDALLQNDNSVLEEDYNEITRNQITSFPTIMINDIKLTAPIKEEDLVKTLCSLVREPPTLCSHFMGKGNEAVGSRIKSIVWLVILFIAINVGIFFVCKKYIAQRVFERIGAGNIDIDGRINNVIGNYFQLKDSKSSSMGATPYTRTFGAQNKTYEAVGSHSLPEVAIP